MFLLFVLLAIRVGCAVQEQKVSIELKTDLFEDLTYFATFNSTLAHFHTYFDNVVGDISTLFSPDKNLSIDSALKLLEGSSYIEQLDCERDKNIITALIEFERILHVHANFINALSLLFILPDTASTFKLGYVFDYDELDLPLVIIDNIPMGANNEKFVLPGPFSSRSLVSFVQGFLDDTLPLLVRSNPVPTSQSDVIVEVVALTFSTIVLDPSRDVLLLVYSPNCGASRAVQSVFNQLSNAILDYPLLSNLIIARFNGAENDFPIRGIKLYHYPTVLFFPASTIRNSSGSLNILYWSDFDGSKSPHNRNVPHSHFEPDIMIDFLKTHVSKASVAQ